VIRRIALLATVAALAMLAACGTSTTAATGGSGSPTATSPTATSTTAAASAAPTATTASGGSSSATVEMGSFSFTSGTSITIKVGQAVTFDDPATGGGTHILVTGTQGQFSAQAGAPSEFSSTNGIMFNPGDSKTITFPTAGTYTITCTIHNSMLATISVTA
jgi:plastocyanin